MHGPITVSLGPFGQVPDFLHDSQNEHELRNPILLLAPRGDNADSDRDEYYHPENVNDNHHTIPDETAFNAMERRSQGCYLDEVEQGRETNCRTYPWRSFAIDLGDDYDGESCDVQQ